MQSVIIGCEIAQCAAHIQIANAPTRGNGQIAQLVERTAVNRDVVGSSPTLSANRTLHTSVVPTSGSRKVF